MAELVLMSLADVWSDISHLHQKDPERTGYATQKPEALLERIICRARENPPSFKRGMRAPFLFWGLGTGL